VRSGHFSRRRAPCVSTPHGRLFELCNAASPDALAHLVETRRSARMEGSAAISQGRRASIADAAWRRRGVAVTHVSMLLETCAMRGRQPHTHSLDGPRARAAMFYQSSRVAGSWARFPPTGLMACCGATGYGARRDASGKANGCNETSMVCRQAAHAGGSPRRHIHYKSFSSITVEGFRMMGPWRQ